MTLDTTLNLPTLVTLAIAIIGLVAWFVRLEGRVTANAKAINDLALASDDSEKKIGGIEALVQLTREQFQSYRTEVAEKYATHAVIADLKRDIIAEIRATETRVENQINRLVETKP